MAIVHIPAPLRAYTGGNSAVRVDAASLREVIDRMEADYPGVAERLLEQGRLRRGMAAFIDGVQAGQGLESKVGAESEIYFSPAIAGG